MNYVKTAMLLAVLTAIFVAVGALIGGQTGMVVAFVLALGMNFFSYWNSDKMVLRMYGAHEVDERSSPEYYGLVRELAQRAGLPMPRVYVMDSPQPNAFATGRNPSHAAVCASTGLLQALSRDEIAGVMAHELAHIKNHDTLTMTIAASIGGAISMLAQYMQFGAMFGGHRDDRSGVGMIGTLVAIIVAPLAAMLVQMAISRSREYGADRMGAADLRPAAVARLGARQDPELRPPHTQRGGGGRSRDGAHVHHQSAVGTRHGQPVLDASQHREPHRRARGDGARDGPDHGPATTIAGALRDDGPWSRQAPRSRDASGGPWG